MMPLTATVTLTSDIRANSTNCCVECEGDVAVRLRAHLREDLGDAGMRSYLRARSPRHPPRRSRPLHHHSRPPCSQVRQPPLRARAPLP